jgi:TonB-linked SusC/RagA family outer membrane protein
MFLFLLTGNVMAQKNTVTGKVTDVDNGTPMAGVTIGISGTTVGTLSDESGKYSIEIPSNPVELTFSFVGYETIKEVIGKRLTIDVAMTSTTSQLNEIVVVGYGTQRKKDLTGSVSMVSTKEITSIPVPSISDALQGKAAGVQVISSGVPGTDATFRVRGVGTINNNNPLLVIDGVPVSTGLNQLNMNDVESIQVLKDASATAIYGSRGANGVLIVTTKRGKSTQSSLDFNYYFGLQQPSQMPEMLNASQFATLHNEMMENAGLATNPEYADPASLTESTDWLGELFNPAPMQNYSLSYSGSTDKTNYYVSGNYFTQDGIVSNTGYKRISVQFNTDTRIFDWLKFGNSLTLNHDLKTSGNYSIRNTMLALPTQPLFQEDGNYSGPVAQPIWDGDITNPIGLAKNVDNSTHGYNMLGSVFGEIRLYKDLHFKSTFGLQANFWNDRTWAPSYHWNSSVNENDYLYERYNKSTTWVWDNYFTYEKTFGEHSITAMAGTSAQENRYNFLNASVQGFASQLTQQMSNGTLMPTVGGNTSSWSLFSYMGRANYAFRGKYMATATLRRDGSSRFGDGNKWGTFPSVSLAWRISDESFMKQFEFLSDMKIRAGFGVTGNQEIGNYTFASALQTIKYTFNGQVVTAVVPTVMPNPNVQWEEQQQSNIGIDATFFKHRLEVMLDAYIKNTEKMLVPMSVPVSTGYSDVYVSSINAGKMQNKGIELTLNSHNLTGPFSWTTSLNFSFNRNEVVDLNDTVPMTSGSIGLNYNLALIQSGYPINMFYGFVTDGIFQNQEEVDNHAIQVPGNDPYNRTSPGDIRFKDMNNDGVINDNDRVMLGNPNPKIMFALGNTFGYKNFDLTIFLQGVAGNQILNANRIWAEAMSVAQNQTLATLDRWTGEGTSNSVPRAVFNDPNKNTRPSDRFIEDGDYLRIKSLILGYTIPEGLLSRYKVKSLRVYASAFNLYTFTKYTGFDPEVGTSGIDNSVYPVTGTYSLGINIGL